MPTYTILYHTVLYDIILGHRRRPARASRVSRPRGAPPAYIQIIITKRTNTTSSYPFLSCPFLSCPVLSCPFLSYPSPA